MAISEKNTEKDALLALYNSVQKIAQTDGDFATAIPSLSLHRRDQITEPLHCIYEMGLGVVIQGEKELTLDETTTCYGEGETLLTTIDLPVVSHVSRACKAKPFIGMMLKIDPQMLIHTIEQVPCEKSMGLAPSHPMSVNRLDADLADALRRMVELLNAPILLQQVAPLIQQEIIFRLLHSPYGPRLRQLAVSGSPCQNISRVVAWMKQHFTQSASMDELASMALMSPSTFRQHFRAVTGMSPLQYMKKLRLQEARQQMLNRQIDASSAALNVGYESASQFSREYTREFGDSPLRDIKKMRNSQRI